MGRKIKYDLDALSIELYDALVKHPQGLDIHDITNVLDVPRHVITKVITKLRLDLGDGDTIAVPIRREDKRQVYFLDSTLDNTQDWTAVRARHVATRMLTDIATINALAKSLDGRSRDGKTVRKLLRHTTYLQAELADLVDELA